MSSILAILKDVEKLFQDYHVMHTPSGASGAYTKPGSIANQTLYGAEVVPEPEALRHTVNEVEAESQHLKRRNSLKKRISFYSGISKSPDRKRLEELVEDFTYWNSKLYNYLPNLVREAVFAQILPAKVFEKSQGTEALSTIRSSVRGDNRYASLEEGAHLWIEVQETEQEEWAFNVEVSDYEKSLSSIPPMTDAQRELSSYTYDAESPGKDKVRKSTLCSANLTFVLRGKQSQLPDKANKTGLG
jgi:hypothetical protein